MIRHDPVNIYTFKIVSNMFQGVLMTHN